MTVAGADKFDSKIWSYVSSRDVTQDLSQQGSQFPHLSDGVNNAFPASLLGALKGSGHTGFGKV